MNFCNAKLNELAIRQAGQASTHNHASGGEAGAVGHVLADHPAQIVILVGEHRAVALAQGRPVAVLVIAIFLKDREFGGAESSLPIIQK